MLLRCLWLSIALHGAALAGASVIATARSALHRPELEIAAQTAADEVLWRIAAAAPKPAPLSEPEEPEVPGEASVPPEPRLDPGNALPAPCDDFVDLVPPEPPPPAPTAPAPRGLTRAALARVLPPPAPAAPPAIPLERIEAELLEGTNAPPRYPEAARRLCQQGSVLVRLQIDPQGTVVWASVARSSGYPLLDRAALAAARQWRFAPARLGSVAVAGAVEQEIVFRLAER